MESQPVRLLAGSFPGLVTVLVQVSDSAYLDMGGGMLHHSKGVWVLSP